MRSPSHLVAFCLLALPPTVLAQADPQTASLSRTLARGAEPQHRVQAARVLGESEDPEALKPLCEGLKDPSGEVRAAVAEALGTLGEPGGLECLEARKEETDEAAKAANAAAVRKLGELKARAPRAYVLFTGVKDTTGTVSAEWVAATEARMRRKLTQQGVLLAPEQEDEKAARGLLARHEIQGYRLVAEIRPGAEGGLKLTVMGLRYPGKKQLLGQVQVQASGAEQGELLGALAPEAIEEAASTFGWKK
jgi:hypothetical protein